LNSFTSSQLSINSGYNSFTQSTDTVQTQQNNRLTSLETFTGSLVTDFVSTTDFNAYTSSNDSKVNNLISATGSYVTTGSNTFTGEQIFSGSVSGEVIPLSVVGGTATMDCSQGNFFTLTVPSSTSATITATNIRKGETITLRLTQSSSSAGTILYGSMFKFIQGAPPSVSTGLSEIDVISFVSFDTGSLFGVNGANFS
jgi:hypothetical protein